MGKQLQVIRYFETPPDFFSAEFLKEPKMKLLALLLIATVFVCVSCEDKKRAKDLEGGKRLAVYENFSAGRDQTSLNKEALEEMRAELEEVKRMKVRLEAVERMRRSDKTYMDELKQLIESQIKAYRTEHRICQIGTRTTTKGENTKKQEDGFQEITNIKFPKSFERTPKVIASIAVFTRNQAGSSDTWWGLTAEARKPTNSSFELNMQGRGTKIATLTAVWIACE